MATIPGVDIQQQSQQLPPQEQPSQEHTASAPMVGNAQDPQNSGGIGKDDQQALIALVRKYKDQWSQNRLVLMQRCTRNLEFFKGNQYISFGPGSTQFSGAGGTWFGDGISNGGHEQNADDTDLYRMCQNFYQMLAVGFIAALCPQVPKSKWMPVDAEIPGDVATAKTAQTLIDIVERDNKESSLLKGQLLYMWCCGAAFRHTRFIVSADRVGTKKQPVFNETETEIMPARMHCYNCGIDSPPAMLRQGGQGQDTLQCRNCGKQLMDDSFYPAVVGPVVQQVGTEEVPQGAVVQDLYNPLEIDCDPAAKNLRETPILNLEVEVHVAALRAAYPDMYSEIKASASSELSANGTIDRIARQQIYSQTNGQTDILSDQKPTLSRTWIQPWAFDLEDDQEFGKRMRQAFPSGVLLINTGETFLNAKEADLNKEWTWAGTHEKFGLYPPAPGDVVVPFQEEYNDLASIMREGIDRCFSGLTLANDDLLGGRSMQGKPLLSGILNGVKLKRIGAPGSMKLSDALYQFEFNLKIQEGMEYLKFKMFNAQMFAMVPPQVYGGQGDPAIETAAGQKQQLGTAMGVLNIYWENIKDEHAAADAIAVECAKDNLTDDVLQVVEEKGGWQNQYVRLDDLQGSVHAYADTDQGLPVTASELRQRWMDLLQAANDKNPVVQAIFDDPTNQEQAADALGVPGMVVPGAAMRNKVMMIIEKLLQAEPIPVIDPQTGLPAIDPQSGKPQLQPSILPTKGIDDNPKAIEVMKQTVWQYFQEKPQLADEKPLGFQNAMLYLFAGIALGNAYNVQDAQAQGSALGAKEGAGMRAAAPPPKPPPQLSPQEQSMLDMVRQDGAEALEDLTKIAGRAPLPKGSSSQAQVAAGNAVLQLAAKVEQIAADKTSIQ